MIMNAWPITKSGEEIKYIMNAQVGIGELTDLMCENHRMKEQQFWTSE